MQFTGVSNTSPNALIQNAYGVPSGVAPFSPSDIAGLALWLDASDAATITQSAGAVSQWNNKVSGWSHAIQASGVNQPITGSRTLNGLNVIDFDGLLHRMDFTAYPSRANGYTYFFVVIPDTAAAFPRNIIGGSAPAGTGGLNVRLATTTLRQQIVRTNQAVLLSGGTNISTATAIIVAGQSSSAGNAVYNNGVPDGSNATNAAYSVDVVDNLGHSNTVNLFDGVMAENLVYTGVLSNANKNLVGAYLSAKWGITWTAI